MTHDQLQRQKYEGHFGGKTGYSETDGASYAGIYEYKGKMYAVTIMNSSAKKVRWKDMKALYKYVRKQANSKY